MYPTLWVFVSNSVFVNCCRNTTISLWGWIKCLSIHLSKSKKWIVSHIIWTSLLSNVCVWPCRRVGRCGPRGVVVSIIIQGCVLKSTHDSVHFLPLLQPFKVRVYPYTFFNYTLCSVVITLYCTNIMLENMICMHLSCMMFNHNIIHWPWK